MQLLAYVYTSFAFVHQHYNILKNCEPFLKELSVDINDKKMKFEQSRISSQKQVIDILQESIFQYNPLIYEKNKAPDEPQIPTKEGYLFKRSSQRVRANWSRRFFKLHNGRLEYFSMEKEEDQSQLVTIDLRLCSVRKTGVPERRFCFEIISPVKKYTLQAESDQEMNDWIKAIRKSISIAIDHFSETGTNDGSGENISDEFIQSLLDENPSSKGKRDMESIKEIQEIAGNDLCADCKLPDPEWCSVNLGILICIDCSGIHRSLGVQFSKVRSLKLDILESDVLAILLDLGNTKINEIYEADVPNGMPRISPSSSRSAKEAWITAKYAKKTFVMVPSCSTEELNMGLWKALEDDNLQESAKYIAYGANVCYKNPMKEGKTPLHQAIVERSTILIEFLLLWCSDLDMTDNNGQTPLHYAVIKDLPRTVVSLLKRNASINLKNNDGKEPLDLALELTRAQIATILRIFILEKDQKKSEIERNKYKSLPKIPSENSSPAMSPK